MVTPEISVRNPRATMWRYASLAGEVDPDQHLWHPCRHGELAAGVEQSREVLFLPRPRPHRAELDNAAAGAGLARWPPMADRDGEPARRIAQQYRVAQAKRCDGADFRAQIQTLIDRLGHLAARFLRGIPFALARPDAYCDLLTIS
jgi:hypothetical protein